MDNEAERLKRTSPQQLARLFTLKTESAGEWRQAELGAILRHQLASPMAPELCPSSQAHGKALTYADLLWHPSPPVHLLRLLKEFAKSHCGHPLSAIPTEVMTVLYYASIVAARLHAGVRISQLTDSELRRGIEWIVDQPWIDDATRCLLIQAMAGLSG